MASHFHLWKADDQWTLSSDLPVNTKLWLPPHERHHLGHTERWQSFLRLPCLQIPRTQCTQLQWWQSCAWCKPKHFATSWCTPRTRTLHRTGTRRSCRWYESETQRCWWPHQKELQRKLRHWMTSYEMPLRRRPRPQLLKRQHTKHVHVHKHVSHTQGAFDVLSIFIKNIYDELVPGACSVERMDSVVGIVTASSAWNSDTTKFTIKPKYWWWLP